MDITSEINAQSLSLLKKEYNGNLSITSDGGSLYDGLAMYDYINNFEGKTNCEVFGLCASAAILPLLASTTRIGHPNSKYLIHNPWTIGVGEAKDFKALSLELDEEQQQLVSIYEQHLTIDKEAIIALMTENRIMNAEEALQINLITTIKNRKMNEPNLKEMEDSIVSRLFNFFKKEIPKNMVLQSQDGTELDFGDEITTKEQIVVGVTATADGTPASGDYIMPNGEVYVFESGVLTEIKPAEEQESLEELREQVTQAIENNVKLKAEVDSLRVQQTNLKNLVANLKTEYVMGDKNTPPNPKPAIINRQGNKRK